MVRFFKLLFYLLLIVIVLTNCQKDKFDVYDRPDWLADPIYQQLQKGQSNYSFNLFLRCIDKSGFKNVLDRAGSYTVFAPEDKAFKTFLNNYYGGDIEKIDSATARKIVSYMMVYNGYRLDDMVKYQSRNSSLKTYSFKRRTVYYKGAYVDSMFQNRSDLKFENSVLFDVNKPASSSFSYDLNDNNWKYIPFFFQKYFDASRLTAQDYTFFFKDSQFTGLNVCGAAILVQDIPAENGYINVIDKVILPLESIDEYLSHKSDYSLFKNVLDTFINFYYSPERTDNLARITGVLKEANIKYYSSKKYSEFYKSYTGYPNILFSPNDESYLKSEETDSQKDGWTMFVPNNNAMREFMEQRLLKYYKTMRNVPIPVLADFVNSHMFNTTVWPSKAATYTSGLGELASFNMNTDVVEPYFGSNGIFYGTNKVQFSSKFYGVFSEIYLNPNYYQFFKVVTEKGSGKNLANSIIDANGSNTFSLFMVPNVVCQKGGIYYNQNTSWNTPVKPFAALDAARWAMLHVVEDRSGDMGNLMNLPVGGYVIGKSLDNNYVIGRKFPDGKIGVFSSGNIDSVDNSVTRPLPADNQSLASAPPTKARWIFEPVSAVNASNGFCFGGDSINTMSSLMYSNTTIGKLIQRWFYDNVYYNVNSKIAESSAVYYNNHYVSFYNYGDKPNVPARTWYCNTFYPDFSLNYIDTAYYSVIKNTSSAPSSFWDKLTGEIKGIPGPECFTILIPDGLSVKQAIADGFLPNIYDISRWKGKVMNPYSSTEYKQISAFFKLHVLKMGVVPDGTYTGDAETMLTWLELYELTGNPEYQKTGNVIVHVNLNQKNQSLSVIDKQETGSNATIVLKNSNILGNKVIMHQVSGYLKYKRN